MKVGGASKAIVCLWQEGDRFCLIGEPFAVVGSGSFLCRYLLC
jgi:hypothetical protein